MQVCQTNKGSFVAILAIKLSLIDRPLLIAGSHCVDRGLITQTYCGPILFLQQT